MVYQSYKSRSSRVRVASPNVKIVKNTQSSYANIRKLVSSRSSASNMPKVKKVTDFKVNNSVVSDLPQPKTSLPIKKGLGVSSKSVFSRIKDKVQEWSENVDYRFHGYLPGSLTPSQAKTRRTEEKLSQSQLLVEATKDKNAFDNQAELERLRREIEFKGELEALKNELDLQHQDWWEYFNTEEKALREAREQFAMRQLQADLKEQENLFNRQLQERGFTDEQIIGITKPQEKTGFFDNLFPTATSKISSTALLIGAGVLGYLLIKKK